MPKNKIVISLGGSLIAPDEIDTKFLEQFKKIIIDFITKDNQVILVCGGGKICRKYNQTVKELNPQVTSAELDALGIRATKLNAELVKLIFGNLAYPQLLETPEVGLNLDDYKVIVAGGWKPGASSDNMAVNLAKTFSADKVINLTNIDYVYDKDPNKFPDAKPMSQMSWSEFRKLFSNAWEPGLNAPFDPVAAHLAENLGLEVAILNGKNLSNLNNYLNSKEFIGTIIK